MHDINGRHYLTPEQAGPGVEIEVDGGFECNAAKSRYTLSENERGALFFPCDQGQHYLDGQLRFEGKRGYYVGVYPVE